MKDLLIATLSATSSQFLDGVLSSAPFDHNSSDKSPWFVPIFAASTEIPEVLVDPKALYQCTPVKVDVWYDELLKQSNLVLVVKSKQLDARHSMLETLGYGAKVPMSQFIAHITLVWDFPPLSSSNKTFINSLSMTYNAKSGITIDLDREMLMESGGYVPNASGQSFFVKDHFVIK